MEDLVYHSVSKEFPGGVTAVSGFDLRVDSGEMIVLVGPSGCGKTTVLRMTAGLETLSGGSITLGDRRLDMMEPRRRNIAMVFQNYALYPHMTVEGNLSFGLRLQKCAREEIRSRVREVAATLEIEDLLARHPGELSGGQRQRVALGRAVIRKPAAYLFDEPLSNLDARLRGEMRAMIRRLYEELRVTSVYVTHDQVEAMTIGERLVVMDAGRIRQVGHPQDCYERPVDTFVASFLGSPAMNLVSGTWDRDARRLRLIGGGEVVASGRLASAIAGCASGEVTLGVRPEHLCIAGSGRNRGGDNGDPPAAAATLTGKVVMREMLGHETLVHVRVGENDLVARGAGEFVSDADDLLSLYADAGRVHLFSCHDGTRSERAQRILEGHGC